MTESVNLLLPKVGRIGTESHTKDDIQEDLPKPRKKGQISRGRTKKKVKTLNHFDAQSPDPHDHDKVKNSEKDLKLGFPLVSVCPAAKIEQQEVSESEQSDSAVVLPQIFMERTNIWGKRNSKKRLVKEKIHLEVEGVDLPLPPPKPLTVPRNKQKQSANAGDNVFEQDDLLGEVADIRRILHCHIVGMPVEIRKLKDDDSQVARPLFHCQSCLDHWNDTGNIREDCKEQQKPVRGPKIVITNETAQLIKSVWKKRAEQFQQQEEARKQKQREKDLKRFRRGRPKMRQQQAISASNVDHIMQDVVKDPDDFNVVLHHIAEGVARNAGFGEHIVNEASVEISNNLANMLEGNKPDDPAVMEVIEKYLGETELMILRSMVDVKKSTSKTDSSSGENASMLLDRLAVLKTRESNTSKDMKAEKVIYLSKLFKAHDKKMIQTPHQMQRAADKRFTPTGVADGDSAETDVLEQEIRVGDGLRSTEKRSPFTQKKQGAIAGQGAAMDQQQTRAPASFGYDNALSNFKNKDVKHISNYDEDQSDEYDEYSDDNYTNSFYSYYSSDEDDDDDDDTLDESDDDYYSSADESSVKSLHKSGAGQQKYTATQKLAAEASPGLRDEDKAHKAVHHKDEKVRDRKSKKLKSDETRGKKKVDFARSDAASVHSYSSTSSKHGHKRHKSRGRRRHRSKDKAIHEDYPHRSEGSRHKKNTHKVKHKKEKHKKDKSEMPREEDILKSFLPFDPVKKDKKQTKPLGSKEKAVTGYFTDLNVKDYQTENQYDDDIEHPKPEEFRKESLSNKKSQRRQEAKELRQSRDREPPNLPSFHQVPSAPKHIVYDVDDISDEYSDDYAVDNDEYVEDEDQTFFIPGNDGYTDSAYDTLVDELVQHYDNNSTFQDKLDLEQVKQAMQRGVVQKTGLSTKYKSTQPEENVSLDMGVTQIMDTQEQPAVKSDYVLKEQQQSPSKTEKVSENVSEKKERKAVIKKQKVDNTNKRKPDFYDKYKRSDKSKAISEVKSRNTEDELNSEMGENEPEKSVEELNTPTPTESTQIKMGYNHKKGLNSGSNMSGNHMNRRDSLAATSKMESSAKHIAVGETHFGMQLDALANLPAVPNPLDVGIRKRTTASTPSRAGKVSTTPKESMRAHHSRQIENSNMDILKGPKRSEQVTLLTESSEMDQDGIEPSAPTQVEKTRQRRSSLQFSLTKKDAPSRTLIGGDHSSTTWGNKVNKGKRPTSSKMPLPPIHKEVEQDMEHEMPEGHENVKSSKRLRNKPIATVKPMQAVRNDQCEPTETPSQMGRRASESQQENREPIQSEEKVSRHIIIPTSDAISILSFTSAFSFSMFNLPPQYQQQNETVKNYNNLVGKTKPREISKTVLNKIPTKEKVKKGPAGGGSGGGKNEVVTRNKVVVNNLNKKVQQKIADPKPIAKYVKKYLPTVTEHHEEPGTQEGATEYEGNTDANARKSLHSNISISIDVTTGSGEQLDGEEKAHITDSGHQQNVEYISVPDPAGGPDRMLSVYASVPLESQMHLNDTESVIIRVQEY